MVIMNMKKSIRFSLLTLILVFILITAYQNCEFDEFGPDSTINNSFNDNSNNNKNNDNNNNNTRISAPLPEGHIDDQCMDSSEYDACVFLKNPVAQNGESFNPPITFFTDLSSVQTYGVKITDTINGFLQNSSYNIIISWSGADRTQMKTDGTWKFEYANDPHHHVAQVMAYYWLTYQMHYMKAKGGWYAENRNVQVNALSADLENDAYFNASENLIALGHFTLAGRIEAALSADIILHEAAHASFYYSNLNRATYSDLTHELCAEDKAICCNTEKGCFKAINEGQADFHSLIIFSSLSPSLNPVVGDGVTNELNYGLGICMARNMDDLRNKSVTDVYNGCDSGAELQGEIHMMGALYASIWWNIYTHSSVVKDEIIELFVEHLPIVNSEDTFETIGRRILSLDQQKFSGKYSQIISQAFKERGLTL